MVFEIDSKQLLKVISVKWHYSKHAILIGSQTITLEQIDEEATHGLPGNRNGVNRENELSMAHSLLLSQLIVKSQSLGELDKPKVQ